MVIEGNESGLRPADPRTPTKNNRNLSHSYFSPHKENPQLNDLAGKIVEHESVISELIGLTRDLSGKVESLIN